MANRYFVTLCSLFTAIFLLLSSPSFVLAKSGCCSPTPKPTVAQLQINGLLTPSVNNKTGAYSVYFDWDDVASSEGYSVAIGKSAGADPGPLVDTTRSTWSFTNVKPGTWYVNLKSKINGKWSAVRYWTVNLPKISVTQSKVKGIKTNTEPTVKAPTPTERIWPTNRPVVERAAYGCNCAKTCTQISSCQEAYYQLNNCGCSVRDGDHDGVPCENLCGK